MSRHSRPISLRNEVGLLATAGIKSVDISRELNVPTSTIRNWLKLDGITKPRKVSGSDKRPKRSKSEKAAVVNLVREGKTPIAISGELDIPPATVRRWLEAEGLDKKVRKDIKEGATLIQKNQRPEYQVVDLDGLTFKLKKGVPFRRSESGWMTTTRAAAEIKSQMVKDRADNKVKYWYG